MKEDDLARALFKAYHDLPPRGKPVTRSNGKREWTVLAGLLLTKDTNKEPVVATLATGNKSLRADRIAASQGRWIHDSHAEILALRAFNRFLLDLVTLPECKAKQDAFLHFRQAEKKWCWQTAWRIHLVVTELPCGDASLQTVLAEQADQTPWADAPAIDTVLRGRAFAHQRGQVRTKPGRADALACPWKSCTDKLIVLQKTTLLKTLLHAFLCPDDLFLSSLVLPTPTSEEARMACEVSLQRGSKAEIQWSPLLTNFDDKKTADKVACNVTLVHSPLLGWTEVLSEGRRLGSSAFSNASMSQFSKKAFAERIASHLAIRAMSYAEMKRQLCPNVYQQRKKVRLALGPWEDGADNDFLVGAPSPERSKKRKAADPTLPPKKTKSE